MHDISLLIDVAMLLVTAFAGGLIARRLGLPTIVGYLLAGMAIGPFTPGFVGDVHDISQLAELGVIFLMFGVGLHFSLSDLWAVRRIAIPGALGQTTLATLCGFGLAMAWGWDSSAALVLGFALSIASTVVLLRSLMDNGLLNTVHGQVAVGWLVLEDLATIVILVILPVLFGSSGEASWQSAVLALGKATIFVVLMLLLGGRFLPWLLTQITFSHSEELFVLAVVAVAVGTALGAAVFFGVSLALGAFLAGVVLGESPISHHIGAEVIPFRDLFAVVFFVSVGMLVNPSYLLANAAQVLAITALVIVGKSLITLLLGLALPSSARTILVVTAGLSQIGEFSFIVGQAGVSLGVLSQDQYSLILAGALISIVLNPWLFRLLPHTESLLQRTPLWRFLDHQGANPPAPKQDDLADHVVIVGAGRVGNSIIDVLERLKVRGLVVENNPERAKALTERQVPTLYGDAANSEILSHAGLGAGRALVVTLPNEAATEIVVANGRRLAPQLPIIARAASQAGLQRLAQLGASVVIHPELEGGLEMMRHTLLALNFPAGQVQHFTDAVRRARYNPALNGSQEDQLLDQLWTSMRGLEIVWRRLDEHNALVGQTLAEANLRATTGAYVIAILRGADTSALGANQAGSNGSAAIDAGVNESGANNTRVNDTQTLYNPPAQTRLQAGDLIGFMGDNTQLARIDEVLAA
jgi:CPA2 family monovalent cation:H+ antiporter-2